MTSQYQCDALTLQTRDINLACFMRYAMPPGTHRATRKDAFGQNAFTFEFREVETCRALADGYCSSEPTAISDVRAFQAATRGTVNSMKFAVEHGEWRAADARTEKKGKSIE